MIKTVLMASIVAVSGTVASAQLFSNANNWAMPNGPIGLGTGPLSGSGVAAPAGFQWSECQNDGAGTANTTAGFGAQAAGPNRLADDFTIPAGQNWNISDIHFFGYVTGSAAGVNPYTSWTLQIWGAGGPGVGVPVFGDTVTNRMGAVSDTNMYRVFSTTTPAPGTAPGTTRLIRDVTVNVGTVLGPGTYWVDFGNNAGFVPALNMPGARTIAGWNAQQFAAGVWAPALDTGNPAAGPDVAQDLPFIINGVPAPSSVALLGLGGLLAARRRRN